MIREDLLALTKEALAALANLGLVKRAEREIAEGKGPALEILDDGTVVGTFEGNVVARLVPKKTLRDCPCTCGAVTVCRHRVATALAYPAWHRGQSPATDAGAASPEQVEWDPGALTDDALVAVAGQKTFDRAEATARSGMVVTVVPWTPRERTPTARLPSCTVRFHVPNDLAYARCDCSVGTGCEHVVIAVWAFRAASASRESRTISLGKTSAKNVAGLHDLRALVHEIARVGVSNTTTGIGERFARVRAQLERDRLVWPLDAVEDLERMVEAYAARSARYDERRASQLLIELIARERSSLRGGELPPAFILGEGQARETLLDHVRLVGLGARLDADGQTRYAEVFLADPDSGDVLVLEKRFDFKEGEKPLEGAELGRRSALSGVPLSALAHGQVVTRAAKRRANGLVVFGSNKTQTSVTPQRGDWDHLPSPLLVRSFAKLEEHLRGLAPRMLRPRVLAEGFHVVRIAAVKGVAYVAAEQRIAVVVEDADHHVLVLERQFARVTPHVIDAVASAAEAGLRFAAGPITRTSRGLVLEPLTLVTENAVVVPDFAPEPKAHRATQAALRAPEGEIASALHAAEQLVAETTHVGLTRLGTSYRDRAAAVRARLAGVGLERIAQLAQRYLDAKTNREDAFFDFALTITLARESA